MLDNKVIEEFITKLDRVADNGQDLARSAMDREPGQRRQNSYWRFVKQELRDLKKLVDADA